VQFIKNLMKDVSVDRCERTERGWNLVDVSVFEAGGTPQVGLDQGLS